MRLRAILLASLFGAFAGVAHAAPASTEVTVEQGALKGRVVDGVLSFKGFPYATPPVGEWRWRPPQPAKAWSGVFDAKAFGNDCMQRLLSTAYAPILTEPSEDCLYMNVWRPAEASATPLPVMVYIYGGGLTRGGSSSVVYGGQSFAKQGVVMVSFNYRVGRFGFFGHPALTKENPNEPKGNYGFMDQVAALQWIQRNIAAFGGDPAKVTIVGESAGGRSVHAMLVSPLARGLFRGAVIQSASSRGWSGGNYLSKTVGDRPSAETIGVNYAATKGIQGTDAAALAKLRALPADQVVDLPQGGGDEGGSGQSNTYAAPFIDGKVIVEMPADTYRAGRQAKVPVMTGYNSADNGALNTSTVDEALARFGGRKADALKIYDPGNTGDAKEIGRKVGSDAAHAEPARFVASTIAAQGIPSYLYRFSYRTELLTDRWKTGTPHAGELAYVFDVVSPYYGPARSPKDLEVAKITNTYWANFVKTGDPNGAGLPNWPKYDPKGDSIFQFRADGSVGAGPDPWKARLDLAQVIAESAKR